MKTTILKISILFLLFSLMGAGCEKDEELIWEISPNSESAIIQKEVNGIEFKFCLLNEEGEPTTVFNQGENFSFYFSVTNNSREMLYFYPGYAYSNENEFCRIYNSNNKDEGKPYQVLNVLDIGVGAYPFDPGESYIFEQLWVDLQDSIWSWEKGTYESTQQKPLNKGNYHTEFQYRFQFERPGDNPTLSTDTLKFKINFKIQEK